MSRGKVVYFNDQTQFGIIQKYNGGGVLVESGALRESGLTTLFEGQRLSFKIVNHNRVAKAVKLLPLLSQEKEKVD